MKYIWILVLCVGIIGLILIRQSYSEPFELERIQGTFRDQTGKVILKVDLEVAKEPKDIEKGLMHRVSLPPQTGMLFRFAEDAPRSFWMRNTLVPLDMVFVTSAGRITNIIHSVPPKTDTLRLSSEPVQYVVELPGGTTEKWGIQAGDRFQMQNV